MTQDYAAPEAAAGDPGPEAAAAGDAVVGNGAAGNGAVGDAAAGVATGQVYGPDAGHAPGSGSGSGSPAGLDELDLALVNALQVAPRAPWTRLAAVLGADPVTLARRWERLVSSGRAWMACYPGPGHGGLDVGGLALVEVEVARGQAGPVAAYLAHTRAAVGVEHMSGGRDLLVTVAVPGPAALVRHLRHGLAAVPGITAARAHIVTRLYQEGGAWRLRALDPGQRRSLTPDVDGEPRPRPVTATERALILALGRDGRMPVADLAREVGVSAATVSRRLASLTRSGRVRLRCEVAHGLSGWPVSAVWWMRVPPPDLDDTARHIAGHPDVRLCAAVTGTANLCTVTWLRSFADVPAFEADLVRRFPRVEVMDRAVTLEPVKRLGRLLGPDGRAVGHVPFDLLPDPSAASFADSSPDSFSHSFTHSFTNSPAMPSRSPGDSFPGAELASAAGPDADLLPRPASGVRAERPNPAESAHPGGA